MSALMIGVFGAGGCGRGIMPLMRARYPGATLVFVEDVPRTARCNGHDVIEFSEFAANGAAIAIAVAHPPTRKIIAARCLAAGLSFTGVSSPHSIFMDDVQIGVGALFSPWTTVTSNVRIGAHFQANLYSYVEHDCTIGDFVTFAPAVRCNGNVSIGDGAYVGSNAVIRQGIAIGENAIVGMGAVVIRDVPPGATVVGNPARPLAPPA